MSGRPRWLLPAFGLSVLLAIAATTAAVRHGSRIGDAPAEVEGWMTPGYIADYLALSPATIDEVLGRYPPGTTLDEIAAASGVPVATLVAWIDARRGADP